MITVLIFTFDRDISITWYWSRSVHQHWEQQLDYRMYSLSANHTRGTNTVQVIPPFSAHIPNSDRCCTHLLITGIEQCYTQVTEFIITSALIKRPSLQTTLGSHSPLRVHVLCLRRPAPFWSWRSRTALGKELEAEKWTREGEQILKLIKIVLGLFFKSRKTLI